MIHFLLSTELQYVCNPYVFSAIYTQPSILTAREQEPCTAGHLTT